MTLELQIERAGLMGQGVARDGAGNIYFVPGAVPGDRVEVSVSEGARKYRDARLLRILVPSPDRREPGCAHFPECGGCDWLHLDYAAQLRAKDGILKHVLDRACLSPVKWLPISGARRSEGYRNRIQVRRRGAQVGFLRKRSQDLVDVQNCLVADPRLNAALTQVRHEASGNCQSKIELYIREDGSVAKVTDRPHGADGFSQIHVEQNEVLQSLVTAHVERRGARRVLELFCGNGNFTHHYSRWVDQVIGVDAHEPALREGRARDDSSGKILFVQSVVKRGMLKKLPQEFRSQYDTLILDPPRLGVGTDMSEFIHPSLKTVIYISCSPVSFSQDVQALKKHFSFAEVQAIDMFPHTRHIEFVARFDRCSPG